MFRWQLTICSSNLKLQYFDTLLAWNLGLSNGVQCNSQKPNISPSFLSSVKCQPVPRPNPRWPIYIIHSIDNTKSSDPRESPRYLEVLKDKTDSSLQMKVCRLLNRALNTKSYLSALYVRSIMIPSEASSSLSRALGSVLRNVSWKLYKMQRKFRFTSCW